MNELKTYQKALEEQTIMKGNVRMVYFDKELETDVLVLDLQTAKGIIPRSEVEGELKVKSLVGFVGREIYYTVTKVDEENKVIYASRKQAQSLLKDSIVTRLQEGEFFNAKIVSLANYGAFVEIEGVTGILKNVDFSEDYTAIREVLKVGSDVNVKLRKISESGRLLFECVQKFKNPTILEFDTFEPDQVVLGTVRNVQPWGIYVNIAPSIDALCPIPGTGEVEEGTKVTFRITQVKEKEKRVRGKILRIL